MSPNCVMSSSETAVLTRQPADLEPLVTDTVRGLQPAIQDKNLRVKIRGLTV